MFSNSWDYINIGSHGFAQVGLPDYQRKSSAEMAILLPYLEGLHPLPEEFNGLAYLASKSFDHEFGRYHEVVVMYERDEVDGWKLDAEFGKPEKAQELMDKHKRFYAWVNALEGVELETPELTKLIEAEYLHSIDTEKGEHLTITKAA